MLNVWKLTHYIFLSKSSKDGKTTLRLEVSESVTQLGDEVYKCAVAITGEETVYTDAPLETFSIRLFVRLHLYWCSFRNFLNQVIC